MTQHQRYRRKLHDLIWIDKLIRDGGYPNSEALARDEHLECSSRTVRRNIEFMRDVLGAPIAYDSSRKGYYYSDSHWSLPSIRISEGELLGVALAQMALQAYRGTPLGDYLRRVTEKLQAALPEEVEIDPSRLASIFRFSLGPVTPFNPEHWELLATAARERRTVWMRYHVLYRDEIQEREVDPYLLRCYRGDWYLIGHDHRTGHIPIFNIARIKALRKTNKPFLIRDDFDPETYLSGTFQVSERPERHRVRIQFFGSAARLVAEKLWHPTQKLTRKKGGSLILEMTVADLDEVTAWVLSFGPDARVLKPVALRRAVSAAARAITARHAEYPDEGDKA